MRSFLVMLCFLWLTVGGVFSQRTWKKEYTRPRCFIENLGQFDGYQNEQTGPILFCADFGKAKVFFGLKGIKYHFMDAEKTSNENEKEFEAKMQRSIKHWKEN